jgi:RNA exonuclease 4
MKLKTLKKRMRFLHRTAKKYSKSGGGKPLNPFAAAWNPNTPPPPRAASASPRHSPSPRRSPSPPRSVSPPVLDEATIQKQVDEYFASLILLRMTGNPEASQIENALAVDCEMVGVGEIKYNAITGRPYRDSSLARVTIVDFKGKKKFDKFVIPKEGLNAVTDYRTDISGIKKNDLERLIPSAHSYERVTEQVKNILRNKIIVGHGLNSDFKALDYVPPFPYMVWDTAKIDAYMKNVPGYGRGAKKLKDLIKEITGNNIQVEGRPHSPLEDARAAMSLYRVFFNYPKLIL